MSEQQLVAWVMLSLGMAMVLTGWGLVRAIAFAFLWQAYTPVRPLEIDLPLLFVAALACEAAYSFLRHGQDRISRRAL